LSYGTATVMHNPTIELTAFVLGLALSTCSSFTGIEKQRHAQS